MVVVNRRAWLGAAVIGVALVAALAGNARTKTVGGAPQAARVPGPPAVGTCVLEPVPAPWGDQGDGSPGYAPGSFGPCTDQRIGEVAGIVDGALRHRVNRIRPADDPLGPFQVCNATVATYLGLPDNYFGDRLNGWVPSLSFAIDMAAPTLRQQDLGQDWVACVVRRWSDPAESYAGTLRGAGGSFSPVFASCLDMTATGDAVSVPCDADHDMEVMGSTDTRMPDPQRQRRSQQCLDLAKTVTGMADPTVNGRLRVSIQSYDLDIVDSGSSGPGMQLTCRLATVGEARLTGPLMGLHDQPVPIR